MWKSHHILEVKTFESMRAFQSRILAYLVRNVNPAFNNYFNTCVYYTLIVYQFSFTAYDTIFNQG